MKQLFTAKFKSLFQCLLQNHYSGENSMEYGLVFFWENNKIGSVFFCLQSCFADTGHVANFIVEIQVIHV